MKSKKDNKKIPTKNYIILAVIVVITILLTFYINAWIKTYKENMYSESVLSGNVKEVNINELKEPFYEINEVVLYVGYNNDKDLYAQEKKLLKEIKKKDLVDEVMYLNVTDNNYYVDILNKRFGNDSVKLGNAPLLIYIRGGETQKVVKITSYDMLPKEFNKIVKQYKIVDGY